MRLRNEPVLGLTKARGKVCCRSSLRRFVRGIAYDFLQPFARKHEANLSSL